jgi:hypothetical protein
MIWQLVAIVVTLVTGAGVSRSKNIGLWYLYGAGVFALLLQVLPWSRWVVIPIAMIAIFFIKRPEFPRFSTVDAATAVVLLAFASFATIGPLWEWDAWAIWALKARVFFEHGSVDWQFLATPSNEFAHADYPLLVPINLGLHAILGGAWDDRWIGLVTVAMLAAGTLAIRQITDSAVVALAFAALGASRYVSTAETPFIVLSVCAIAFLRAGEWRHASVLLGFAALTKNEGLALLVACAIASRRDAVRLWPAAVIAAPWLLARAFHRLPGDLSRGDFHGAAAADIARLLIQHLSMPWLWLAIAVALPLALLRERWILAIVGMQLLFCVAVYLITPHDVAWHIGNSWDRVSRQLVAMAAFAVVAALSRDVVATADSR